jgi:hypothetical protein
MNEEEADLPEGFGEMDGMDFDSPIVKALKQSEGEMRLTHEGRWMLWNNNEWTVCERKRHASTTKIIITTHNELIAVRALLGQFTG